MIVLTPYLWYLLHKNTVKVSDADLKPLNTVLASYTTEYDPSNESRTHNIQLASDKINGTLIKTGCTVLL